MARLDILVVFVSAAFPPVIEARPRFAPRGLPIDGAGGLPAHPGTADR